MATGMSSTSTESSERASKSPESPNVALSSEDDVVGVAPAVGDAASSCETWQASLESPSFCVSTNTYSFSSFSSCIAALRLLLSCFK